MVTESTSEHSLTIRRTFNASRQIVFDAWTQPEHLRGWWRAHENYSTPLAEVDLRVGGKYRLGMLEPGKEKPFVCSGEFRKVDPPSKLVYTWSWENPGLSADETLVTVEFFDKGQQTEVVLTHENFLNAELTAKHNEGWTGCLAQLARWVES